MVRYIGSSVMTSNIEDDSLSVLLIIPSSCVPRRPIDITPLLRLVASVLKQHVQGEIY